MEMETTAAAKRQLDVSTWPMSLLIEPCSCCNLRCPLCAVGSGTLARPPSFLDLDVHKRLVSEIAGHVRFITYHGQGEPFLHPRFLELVRQANAANISTWVSTNGHFLGSIEACDEVIASGLAQLTVSLDGATADTYSRYRVGGDFELVLAGIRCLIERRRQLDVPTPKVQLQFLVFRHNEGELAAIRRLAESLQVDVLRVKTAHVPSRERLGEYAPTDDGLCRYERNGRLKTRPRELQTCWYVLNQPFIAADGRVAPCCFDKDCQFAIGSLADNSLQELWNSPTFDEFRARVRDRTAIPLCANCTDSLSVPTGRRFLLR
jgi:radical SAM protein with 4Fe4S-binding SPASM domain